MQITLQSQGVQAGPMLREFGVRDFLQGALTSDIALEFSGDTLEEMLSSLTGKATVSCLDGALLGVDLLHEMQEPKIAEADSEGDREFPRTDFSELKSVVVVSGGRVEMHEATVTSPALTLLVGGTADLVGRQWNLQVVPGEMPTAEQGERGSPLPPLTVTGTFAEPRFQVASRGQNTDVVELVNEKIPSPVDDDVKNLVGKALIDPAIVAERFHLQPKTIKRSEAKKQIPVGRGKIRINPLREETSVH
jgi:uncharacterized protein involved in outer membrane biogenesis